MSNWFEDNPTKSIIIYTITLLAVAYATMYFILDENKEKQHKVEKENLNSQIQTLKERISLLEFDNQTLRNENQKQTEWLQSIPGTGVYFERKITDLQKSLASKDSIKINGQLVKPNKYNIESSPIDIGSAFIDQLTGASIGINEITIDREASGIINLPGQPEIRFTNAVAGKRWSFGFDNKRFYLLILELNWIGKIFRIKLLEK